MSDKQESELVGTVYLHTMELRRKVSLADSQIKLINDGLKNLSKEIYRCTGIGPEAVSPLKFPGQLSGLVEGDKIAEMIVERRSLIDSLHDYEKQLRRLGGDHD